MINARKSITRQGIKPSLGCDGTEYHHQRVLRAKKIGVFIGFYGS
jgi:hypothetical protein